MLFRSGERIDLTVGVRDGGTDLCATVLEDEDVGDVGAAQGGAVPVGVAESRAEAAPVSSGSESMRDKLATEGLLFTRIIVGQAVHVALSASATVILLYFLLASQSWLLSRTVEVVRRPRARAHSPGVSRPCRSVPSRT